MSLAERITRHYGGNWNAGAGQGNIPGEGHSKDDRSVSVKDAPDRPDGILVCCRGAGDWRAEMDRFRRDGLLDPFEPRKPGNGKDGAAGDWRCTGTYSFDDGTGEDKILYRTRRMEKIGEKKRFVAERFEAGRWVKGLGDTPRVLYRLTALRRALGKAAKSDMPLPPIYFVEGERKADKLIEMGFLATAISFGAEGWRQEYAATDVLVDAPVVILPDHDDKGRAFAAKVKAGIEAAGGKAHILELPGLLPKGDIMDWPGSADELRRLTVDAIAGKVRLLPVIDLKAWDADPPPRLSAWGDWLPLRQTTMLTGRGGIGKSLFDQALLTHIAMGRPFLGLDTRQANCLYITCEDDADELWRRQKGICAAMGLQPSDLDGKLHLVSLCGETDTALGTFDDNGKIIPTERWRQLVATTQALDIGIYAFDNATDAMAGDLNDIHQVAEFVNMLTGLAISRDGVAMILHHPNKAGEDWLGSVAWHNKVRSRLIIEDGENEDDHDSRLIRNPKANYGPQGGKVAFRWWQGTFVRDEDLPPDAGAELAAVIRASAENKRFLECLVKATEERRATSPSASASNYAPRVFAKMATGKGVSEQGFAAAMERLLHLGTIANGQRVYQRDNRTWATGLALVECAQTTAQTPAQSDAQRCTNPVGKAPVSAGDDAQSCMHSPPHISTIYEGGPPPASAPPSFEDCPRCDGEGCGWCEASQ